MQRCLAARSWLVRSRCSAADRPDAVPDEIREEGARHYSERQLAALVVSIATINVWDRGARVAGQAYNTCSARQAILWRAPARKTPPPGSSPGQALSPPPTRGGGMYEGFEDEVSDRQLRRAV